MRSGRRSSATRTPGSPSILRSIGNAPEVFVEDRLFATLDPLTREIDLGENTKVLLTDTVGFIRKLPHNLVASFRATLEEVNEADLLLHVIDASHPVWEEQRDVVEEVLAELGAEKKPMLYVFSKIDALPASELGALEERIGNLVPNSVFVSSVTEGGLDPLRRALLVAAREGTQIAEIRLPAEDGKLLAEIYRNGSVLSQRTDDGQIVLRARLDEQLAGRIKRLGASVAYPR